MSSSHSYILLIMFQHFQHYRNRIVRRSKVPSPALYERQRVGTTSQSSALPPDTAVVGMRNVRSVPEDHPMDADKSSTVKSRTPHIKIIPAITSTPQVHCDDEQSEKTSGPSIDSLAAATAQLQSESPSLSETERILDREGNFMSPVVSGTLSN